MLRLIIFLLTKIEYGYKVNQYEEELRTLKAQVKELKKHKEHEAKGSKKQQEYLIQLEQKHREVCSKFGVSPSNTFGKEGIQILIFVNIY